MFYNKWIDPTKKYAFSGVSKIYQHYLGAKNINEIKTDLAGIRTYTLHKEKKKVKDFNPFFIYRKHQQWQIDICYLPEYANKENKEKYILCLIEVFSRKLFIKVINRKDWKTVLDAFSQLHEEINTNPENILVDKGGEFTNQNFKQYCREKRLN